MKTPASVCALAIDHGDDISTTTGRVRFCLQSRKIRQPRRLGARMPHFFEDL